jgi:hypothetical protein
VDIFSVGWLVKLYSVDSSIGGGSHLGDVLDQLERGARPRCYRLCSQRCIRPQRCIGRNVACGRKGAFRHSKLQIGVRLQIVASNHSGTLWLATTQARCGELPLGHVVVSYHSGTLWSTTTRARGSTLKSGILVTKADVR